MSYRGINPSNNTVQVWTGTQWESFNTLAFTTTGTDATLTSGGDLTLDATGNATLQATAAANVVGTTLASLGAPAGGVLINAGASGISASTTGGGNIALNPSGNLTSTTTGTIELTGLGGGNHQLVTSGPLLVNGTGLTQFVATSGAAELTSSSDEVRITSGGSSQILITPGTQVTIAGNLDVQGTTTTIDSQNVNIADRYLNLASGLTTGSNISAGWDAIINVIAGPASIQSITATTITVDTGEGALFAADDIIEISDAANTENNGRFAVDSVAVDVITIKAAPNNGDILQSTLVADATVQGSLTQIALSGMRVNGSGTPQSLSNGISDSGTFNWQNLAVGAGNDMQAAYDLSSSTGPAVPMVQTDGTQLFTVDLVTGSDFNVTASGSSANFGVSIDSGDIGLLTVSGDVGITSSQANINMNAGAGGTGLISLVSNGGNSDFTAGGGGTLTLDGSGGLSATSAANVNVNAGGTLLTNATGTTTIQGNAAITVQTIGTADTPSPAINVLGGDGLGTNAQGGPVFVAGGDGVGGPPGGNVQIDGGANADVGQGGAVVIQGGVSTGASGNGGRLEFRPGSSAGASSGQVLFKRGSDAANQLIMGDNTDFDSAATNDVLIKGASGEAEWVTAGSIVGITLQDAYEGGNTITTDAGNGPLSVSGTEAITLNSDGIITIASTAASQPINITATGAATLSSTTGQILVQSVGTSNTQIESGSGGMVLDSAGLMTLNSDGVMTIATTTASQPINITATGSANFVSSNSSVLVQSSGTNNTQIEAGTGGMVLDSAGVLTLNSDGVMTIATTAASQPINITATGSANLSSSGSSASVSSSGTNNTQIQAGSGGLALVSTTGFVNIQGQGTDADQWPNTNGTAGQILAIQSVGTPNVLEWIDPPSTGAPAKSVTEYTASSGALAPTVATLEANEVTYAVTSDAALTVTLPTPEPAAGTVVRIKDASGTADTNNITVSSTNNIDGASAIIATPYGSFTIQSRGSGNGYMIV